MASRRTALTLYRSILRAHASHLPPEMRSLGDAYVKSEFRLHKAATDQQQLEQFYAEWTRYLQHLESTARARDTVSAGVLDDGGKEGRAADSAVSQFGNDMPKDLQLSEEQLVQLAKLREEAQKAAKDS
mmetsp:Transcript_35457/g.76923  ORF Transcript_35457/g.76923 Transcript_35457/m.76923 type:complete len:129 (+) Transcript_35457:192-578(+)